MKLPRKLPMKLRTRLFLSISAVITVALFGLFIGLIGMTQMARTQENLLQSHYAVIDTTQQLRHLFGDQLATLAIRPIDRNTLDRQQRELISYLDEAIERTRAPGREGLEDIRERYLAFMTELGQPDAEGRLRSLDSARFARAFTAIRDALTDVQRAALEGIRHEGVESRKQATWLSILLGTVALMVLIIGFLTAHTMARRFVGPIEKLAKAADRIGQGDFQIVLPMSPIAELSSLSRRFGVMASALQQFNETNIAALKGGQRRLQAVLDCIDDGLLIVARDGTLEHANPVAERQLGWDTERIGVPLGEALAHPELDEAVRLVLAGQSREDPQEDLALEIGGEQRLLAWRLIPFGQPNVEVEGAVMVLRDVTDQRAFERVRNEFVLRASHELRTPVTGMHMAFGLLRERLHFQPDAREQDLIETVDEEMRRLVRLINDLLNFSRYQTGQQKLELSACSPSELLQETLARFEASAAEHGTELKLEIEDNLPLLNLDRTQMERVLDNLVTNALRHTTRGGHICLQARRHTDRVIISVEDNGEGIPYSQQARIFEPFVQVGRKKGGAGLGLALCKEITRLHGGRIGIHSRVEHGTIVYMALPV
ncbi:ATP-binding protein [Pseudomonas matsuisoli]|uniref:histidine kinase n=1 Tax=Pseudomonas matsuisoli TaxID=1515666 RepID=A0A917PWW4_9PSED|nr:PAS domain-containing sensor histidine kinase [Pseudomonas matsuisoli]